MQDNHFVNLWMRIVNIIENVAKEFDKRWRQRRRKLDSKFLILFILRLVLSKNKQGYGCTLEEIWENSFRLDLPNLSDKPFSASSVCEARLKLDESIFKELNDRVICEQELYRSDLWHNHRLFAVDGSKINLPRQLLDYGYNLPSNNAYYPQGLVSSLYELKSKVPRDFMLVNHGNERICAQSHLDVLEKEDVVVYDRGYMSYVMLYTHIERQIHCIFRLPRGQSFKEIERFWNSKEKDSIITIYPAETTRRDLEKEYPEIKIKALTLRLIKYTIDSATYCLGTTLIGERYPAHIFPDVYHSRWGIEELYKISKQLIDVEDFHSKSERGVKQELYAHFFLITAARMFEGQANENVCTSERWIESTNGKRYEVQQKDQEIKINFKNCLLVITRSLEEVFFQVPFECLKKTVNRMLNSISRLKQKVRPNRHYPRISMKPIKKWRSRKERALST